MRLTVTDMRTITDDEPRRAQLEFRNNPVSVGSHSQSGIQLPDTRVPEHHATLEPVGNDWFFQPTTRDDDLTRINDQPVTGRTRINDGDVISITYFELKVEIEPEVTVEIPAPSKVGELALIKKYPIPPRSIVRKPDADVTIPLPRQKLLGELVATLRRCDDLPSLMEHVAEVLGSHFDARMIWIGLRSKRDDTLDFVEARLDGEPTTATPPKLETFEYRCLSRDQFICIKGTGDGVTQSVLAVPLNGPRFPIGMIYVDTKRRTRILDDADLDFLTLVDRTLTPLFVAALEQRDGLVGADFCESPATGIEYVRELVDPLELPRTSKFELAAHTRLGRIKHGDLFDAARTPSGLFVLFAGYVETQPGNLAATLPEIKGAFRIGVLHQHSAGVMLRSLNWLLSGDNVEHLLHAAVAVVNPKNGAVEIATAGDVGAVAFTSKGTGSMLTSKDAPPAGNGKPTEYGVKKVKTEPGTTITLYTPGVLAATDDDGTRLTEKRFLKTLRDVAARPASTQIDEVLSQLGSFLQNEDGEVDLTLLLGHRLA